jgi:hypothetical protein
MTPTRALAIESPALRLALSGLGVAALSLVITYVLWGKELPFLLAGVAGLFCVWLFRHPHWGVLAIFSFWFLRVSPTLLGSPYLQLSYIISVLLCVPLGLRLLRDREVWVWRIPQVKYLLAIGLIFTLSTLWADYFKYPVTVFPELDWTTRMARDFVTRFAFLVFFLYFVNTRGKLAFAVWLVIGLVTMSVASAYLNVFTLRGMTRANAGFGLAQSPTVFPYICMFAASLLWGFYTAAPTRRWKGWLVPLLVGIPAMAIGTGSRTGLLQLLTFGTLVFVDRSGGWSKTKRVRGIVLLICVGFLVSLVVPAIAVLRATTFETTASAPGAQSLKDRVQTVSNGLALLATDPILGVGPGNFLWLNTAHHGLDKLPHNSYLGALVEGGVGMLALYLLAFLATYRMLRQLETWGPRDFVWMAKGFRFNLILLMVYSLTDDTWLQVFPYFIFAATGAMYRLWATQPAPAGGADAEPAPARVQVAR